MTERFRESLTEAIRIGKSGQPVYVLIRQVGSKEEIFRVLRESVENHVRILEDLKQKQTGPVLSSRHQA